MSAKNGSKAAAKKAAWKGYVNIRIPEGTTLESLSDLCDSPDIESVIESLLEAGYKVSISKDWDSGARVVSITGDKEFCENAGYTTSTWAGSVEGGLYGSYWKAFVAYGGTKWDSTINKRTFEI